VRDGRAELLVPHGSFRRFDLDQHKAAKGLLAPAA
jgi:hypothetical protein